MTLTKDTKDFDDTNLQGVIRQLVAKLSKKGIYVLITIDEVEANSEIKQFASFYQLLVRENYLINLMMTGLPENISDLQNDKVLTFLLWRQRIALSALNLTEVKLSYAKVFANSEIEVDDQTLNQLAKMTKGYSYTFQLLGYLIWNEGRKEGKIDEKLIEQVKADYLLQLDQNAYSKIFSSLSEQDQNFVFTMAKEDTDKVDISKIREKMHKTSGYIAMYSKRLMDDQVITASGYGKVSFIKNIYCNNWNFGTKI